MVQTGFEENISGFKQKFPAEFLTKINRRFSLSRMHLGRWIDVSLIALLEYKYIYETDAFLSTLSTLATIRSRAT